VTEYFEWHLVTIGMTEYLNNIQFSNILTFYYSTIWNNIKIKIKQDNYCFYKEGVFLKTYFLYAFSMTT
jgi:hypothetical protein